MIEGDVSLFGVDIYIFYPLQNSTRDEYINHRYKILCKLMS